jgi:CDP-diacylglycerol pyrophosphatase
MVLPGRKKNNWEVRGIEDPQIVTAIKEKKSDYEYIIKAAWDAAFQPKTALGPDAYNAVSNSLVDASGHVLGHLPVSTYAANIGIGLNPATTRSQHQMHIHIALVPRPIR